CAREFYYGSGYDYW
nr:immunoglobulin heavy chain junction region [Mus musculus]MBK4198009.1 immunoglobulin heavy chain junction region [Mus musculus]MBK4198010.1 immunoglobulin heavy chain junction region [Mus musculus]MBK4198012.1 immunoglobulin heavy chain junction region [Mus musculus]